MYLLLSAVTGRVRLPQTVVVYCQHVYLLLSAVTGRVRLHRLLLFIVNTCTYSYQLSLAVSDSIDCCCLSSTRVPTPISCHWPCQTPSTVVVYSSTRVPTPISCHWPCQTPSTLYLLLSPVVYCCCLSSTRVPTPISCHWPCQTPRLLLFTVNTCTYSYQLSLAVSDSIDCCCLSSTRVPTPISCHWPCQTPSTVVVYCQHVYLLLSAVTGRVRLHRLLLFRLLLFTVNTCTYSYQLSLAVSDSLDCCCLLAVSTRVPTPISCHWPCQTSSIDCCCLLSTRVPTPISCHWPCQTPSTVVVYRQHVYLLLSAVTGRVRLPP